MAEISTALAVQQLIARQDAAMAMVRQRADSDQAMVSILEQAALEVAPSGKGTAVDVRA